MKPNFSVFSSKTLVHTELSVKLLGDDHIKDKSEKAAIAMHCNLKARVGLHAVVLGCSWPNLNCACAGTIIPKLPVKILTRPFDSETSISYTGSIFWRSIDIHHVTLTFDPLTLNM